MLDLEYKVKLVVVLDDHTRAHLGGGNRHRNQELLAGFARVAQRNSASWPVSILA